MTKDTPMPENFAELAQAIRDMRDAGSNLDATKARVAELTLALVPAARDINPDFEYQTVGHALAALESVGSLATALACHNHYDKLRRVLGMAKPPSVQRGPGGGR